MAKKNNHEIELTGNTAGLVRATGQAERMLDGLSKQAVSLNGILGSLGNSLKGAGGLSPAFVALGGVASVAAAGITAVMASAAKANALDQLAQSSLMNVEYLQQLAHAFSVAGVKAEEFGAINKDALKNLGEGIASGGGIAEDLKKYGMNIKDFTKYIGEANGGVKASISLFYQMRDAGATTAETTSAMEKLAGGSSKLINTLTEAGSEQAALNMAQEQNVDITEDAIKSYREFSGRMSDFEDKAKGAIANGLAPLVDKMVVLYDWWDKDWKNTSFYKTLSEMGNAASKAKENAAFSPVGMTQSQLNNVGATYTKAELAEIKYHESMKAAQIKADKNMQIVNKNIEERKKAESEKAAADRIIQEREAKEAAEKALKAKEQADKEAERLGKETQRKRDAEAKEAQRLADQQAKDAETLRKTQLDTLNRINIEGYSREAATMASAQVKLGNSFNDLKTLYDQGIIDAEQYQQKKQELLAANGENFYQSLIGADPEKAEEMIQASQELYNRELENLQLSLENKLIMQEEYQAKVDALDQGRVTREEAIQKASMELQARSTNAQLATYEGMTDAMGSALTAFGGENSKAAKAAFAVSKGLAIAQAMIAAPAAASKAMESNPYPYSIALAAAAYGQVLTQVASIKSVKGQFHDGIDNVPSTGTYLLEKGERVVDKRLNDDLKGFINHETGGQPISVNAPLNISGNVNSSDQMVMNAIKNHPQMVARAVEDAQRRRM